jgi:hypothetical protein
MKGKFGHSQTLCSPISLLSSSCNSPFLSFPPLAALSSCSSLCCSAVLLLCCERSRSVLFGQALVSKLGTLLARQSFAAEF